MYLNPVDSRWLYNAVDNTLRFLHPLSEYYHDMSRQLIRYSDAVNLSHFHQQKNDSYLVYYLRLMAASLYVNHMMIDTYQKPAFGITQVKIDTSHYDVAEEIMLRKSFCDLLHFKKLNFDQASQPKILLVAPMSGHFATLLRQTVKDMLPHYDVYITDWKNARDVPLSEGSFDFNDFVQYLITFFEYLGSDLHVMAVCQPTVPVLVALAVMSGENNPALPKSAIMLGGPIDTEQQPTLVNRVATTKGEDWFVQNVISCVPNRYPGYMRLVYPGFLQLSGFLSMNLERHIQSMRDAIINYAKGNKEGAFKTIEFYSEYLATMDLTAEFYMQTINMVFINKVLTKGRIKWLGKYADIKDIKHTAILAIEGELDDITGIGQTKSVLNLCNNLPDSMKKYILAPVGHYGLFNGSKFRKFILPEIINFTQAHGGVMH